MMADEDLDALYAGLQPHAREFLRAYVKTKTIVDAAEVVGIARSTHYAWLKNMAGYPEAFELAKRDVVDQWRRLYSEVTEKGLREQMYDAKGELKHTRYRQDAALLKAHMTNIDPEFAPDRDKSTTVNIVVVQSKEGW